MRRREHRVLHKIRYNIGVLDERGFAHEDALRRRLVDGEPFVVVAACLDAGVAGGTVDSWLSWRPMRERGDRQEARELLIGTWLGEARHNTGATKVGANGVLQEHLHDLVFSDAVDAGQHPLRVKAGAHRGVLRPGAAVGLRLVHVPRFDVHQHVERVPVKLGRPDDVRKAELHAPAVGGREVRAVHATEEPAETRLEAGRVAHAVVPGRVGVAAAGGHIMLHDALRVADVTPEDVAAPAVPIALQRARRESPRVARHALRQGELQGETRRYDVRVQARRVLRRERVDDAVQRQVHGVRADHVAHDVAVAEPLAALTGYHGELRGGTGGVPPSSRGHVRVVPASGLASGPLLEVRVGVVPLPHPCARDVFEAEKDVGVTTTHTRKLALLGEREHLDLFHGAIAERLTAEGVAAQVAVGISGHVTVPIECRVHLSGFEDLHHVAHFADIPQREAKHHRRAADRRRAPRRSAQEVVVLGHRGVAGELQHADALQRQVDEGVGVAEHVPVAAVARHVRQLNRHAVDRRCQIGRERATVEQRTGLEHAGRDRDVGLVQNGGHRSCHAVDVQFARHLIEALLLRAVQIAHVGSLPPVDAAFGLCAREGRVAVGPRAVRHRLVRAVEHVHVVLHVHKGGNVVVEGVHGRQQRHLIVYGHRRHRPELAERLALIEGNIVAERAVRGVLGQIRVHVTCVEVHDEHVLHAAVSPENEREADLQPVVVTRRLEGDLRRDPLLVVGLRVAAPDVQGANR